MDIPLRRGAVDRRAALVLVGYVAVATGAFVAAALLLDGAARVTVLVVLLVLWLLVAGTYAWTWTRIREVASPLGLHGTGVVSRSQFGQLVLPWEAVESITLEGSTLVIRPVPAGDPRGVGVDATALVPSALDRVQRRGVNISLAALDISPADLRQAVTVQSGGRFRL